MLDITSIASLVDRIHKAPILEGVSKPTCPPDNSRPSSLSSHAGVLARSEPSAIPVPCPGVHVNWDVDSFWDTYPFHKHGPKSKRRLDYHFVSLDPIRARSNRCLGIAPTGDGACIRCSDVGIDINVLKERAGRPFDKVHTEEDLSYQQLRDKLSSVKRDMNTLKLKVFTDVILTRHPTDPSIESQHHGFSH